MTRTSTTSAELYQRLIDSITDCAVIALDLDANRREMALSFGATDAVDSAAEDWLSVASAELAGYPVNLVRIGCDAARRECTHHSQIVPFVLTRPPVGLLSITLYWNETGPAKPSAGVNVIVSFGSPA